MPNEFSPKDYLRSKRPERFSDSVRQRNTSLNRSTLEYHLDTLTNRNQETEFERLALAIAQKTICPNLRSQTGPTGGGDAKVDSETFPVANQLALAWFIGENIGAASERWAFAFSAKKTWAPKVRSDVEKISNTERGYQRVFFISNQFISDRNRSKEEDELSKKHGFQVTIFDRTWILDQIFSSQLEEITVKILALDTPTIDTHIIGDADAKRKSDLAKLEASISEQVHSGSLGPKLVNDCLNSAIIARALELPDFELDGRFSRAESMARQFGTSRQQIEVAYQQAWTAYWWKEDYSKLNDIYPLVEKLVISSESVEALQLLHNLWFLLFTTEKIGTVSSGDLKIKERTIVLAKALGTISSREDLPTGRLQARSMLAIQQIAMTLPNAPESVFKQLEEIVRESDGLIGFPLDSLIETLTEVGQFFVGNSDYDNLFETMLDITSKRSGEIAKGRMLVDRGIQLAAEDRYYEAIRVIGRCLTLFAKDETIDDLILALFVSGHSYEKIGLPWAARGSFLNAAALIVRKFETQADLSYLGSKCFAALKRAELSLGRISPVLLIHKFDLLWRNNLTRGDIQFKPSEEDNIFDLAFGILMLTAKEEHLKLMSRLPDILQDMGLDGARIALLHALGYDTDLSKEITEKESIHDFFLKWRNQPAANEIAPTPVIYTGDSVDLESQILGCHITMKSERKWPCIEFSESLLAALESMLATGMKERLFAVEHRLKIEVSLDHLQEFPFSFTLDDPQGIPTFKITLSTSIDRGMSRDQQTQLMEKISDISFHIFFRTWQANDIEQAASNIFDGERALERSLNFTSSLMASDAIFGKNFHLDLNNWHQGKESNYPLKRNLPWDSKPPDNFNLNEWITNTRDQPQVRSDGEGLNQRQFKTRSLIRATLWDRAKWKGVGFFYGQDTMTIPTMGLLFENNEAASDIFLGLIEDVGRDNKDKKLKITFIKGISKSNPHSYRMMIGYNVASITDRTYFGIMNRMHTMDPKSSANLDMFLQVFSVCKKFILSHATPPNGASIPQLNFDHLIQTDMLTVREAWTIGVNDPDMMAIHPDDEPIIPQGTKDAPILALLELLRQGPQVSS